MIRWPAEWEPHERTVMCWPARHSAWGRRGSEAEQAYADVARAIARFEPVTMIAAAPTVERAAELCGGSVELTRESPQSGHIDPARQPGHGIEVVELAIDDSWFRDSGPVYVVDDSAPISDDDAAAMRRSGAGDQLIALDWRFNSWGEKFLPFDSDAAVARRWAEHAGHRVRTIDMVLEGGSISTDGAGTIVTTTQCLMHPNRNPGLSQADIERRVLTEFGADRMLWLPYGLALDDDTDGHVDNVAAFTPDGHLLLQGCDDPSVDDHLRMNVNRRVAAGSVETIEVPVLPFTEVDDRYVAVPYLNYYVGNGFVIVPTCGHPADDDMVALIGEQYPGRETFGLDVGAIIAYGGGGIHCITQQIPAASNVTPGRSDATNA